MKGFVISLGVTCVLLMASMANASTAIVYFFTGGPIEGPRGPAMTTLTEFMAGRFATAKFQILHNSASHNVCTEIKKEIKEFPNDKIILAGHSYGANATESIAGCLAKAKINVDMIIPLDPIQRPFTSSVDVVPDNVGVAHSFYQAQDALLRGHQHLHRADGSDRGITNTLTTVPPGSLRPHHTMCDVLMEAGVIQDLIAGALK
jgi:hypothetical protein